MTRSHAPARAALVLALAALAAAPAAASSSDDASPRAAPAPLAQSADAAAPEARLRADLADQGYDVRRVKRDDGRLEAYALKDGRRWEIYADARDGRVLRIEEDD